MNQPNIKINVSNWLKAAPTDFIKFPFNLQVYFFFLFFIAVICTFFYLLFVWFVCVHTFYIFYWLRVSFLFFRFFLLVKELFAFTIA